MEPAEELEEPVPGSRAGALSTAVAGGTQLGRDSFEASSSLGEDDDDEDDEAVEHDPSGRYCRYLESVGKGRFKNVFKAFDEESGLDLAWSKISADEQHLSRAERAMILAEMEEGLELDHPCIIKAYVCWDDPQTQTINLLTELFTSGNLRQYRQAHKHLDFKALKKWARQILRGLEYLHSQSPPVVHGDLRCDKIYVNGHSGEIKIGDLGLTTLLPRRFEDSDEQPPQEDMTSPAFDVFAFGLCMLELVTLHQLDPTHCRDWQSFIDEIPDALAAELVTKCLGTVDHRPTASELLDDAFFQRAGSRVQSSGGLETAGSSAANLAVPGGFPSATSPTSTSADARTTAPEGCGPCEACTRDSEAEAAEGEGEGPGVAVWDEVECTKIKGEDFSFRFKAIKNPQHNNLSFKVVIVAEGNEPNRRIANKKKVALKFEFNPDDDTAETVAEEFGVSFQLSETDISIFSAGIKEWIPKLLPNYEPL